MAIIEKTYSNVDEVVRNANDILSKVTGGYVP